MSTVFAVSGATSSNVKRTCANDGDVIKDNSVSSVQQFTNWRHCQMNATTDCKASTRSFRCRKKNFFPSPSLSPHPFSPFNRTSKFITNDEVIVQTSITQTTEHSAAVAQLTAAFCQLAGFGQTHTHTLFCSADGLIRSLFTVTLWRWYSWSRTSRQ